jgi:hypothetical protein
MSAAAAGMFGMNLAGAAYSGWAQYEAGKEEKAAYQYNADIVMRETEQAEEAAALKSQALLGRQRSLYAKAGVDITSGSPLLIALDTAMQAQKEQARIQQAGTSKATLLRYYGKMAKWRGEVAGISTFLSGLGMGTSTFAAQGGFSGPELASTSGPTYSGYLASGYGVPR